ncbi:MAG: HlyD family secretion protein [Prevotellaceae bacterium]|jgi:multidrug resistance efflux pump|nr:HlyD family secretion protein [Prevotellaceae bacterium]
MSEKINTAPQSSSSGDLEGIELRSEEFQEILSRIPPWIQRWGITLIFILLAALLTGSWFFKYPEIVTAPIVVTTENLPVNIVAKISGRIDTLYITEKQAVKKEQILGVLENPAKTEDVLALHSVLTLAEGEGNKRISNDDKTCNMSLSLPFGEGRGEVALQLGDLQPAFSAFQKSNEDLRFFCQTDYHNKKIKSIEKQKIIQQNILNQSYKTLAINRKQLATAANRFRTDSTLFAKKVMSAFEFETSKNAFLQSQQSFENAKTAIENQKLGILQLEQTVFDLQQQKNEQLSQLKISLETALHLLKAQIRTWEQTCLLVSQVDGTATFTKYWQKNQNVLAGETILTVIPAENQRIIGKIYLAPQGAGKVKIGQTVNVKFDNFPFMEYGMVKVEVKNIALVPIAEGSAKSYILEVDFPQNLTTTYSKNLSFSQEMSGAAEIITEDLRLIERLINPIKAIFDK